MVGRISSGENGKGTEIKIKKICGWEEYQDVGNFIHPCIIPNTGNMFYFTDCFVKRKRAGDADDIVGCDLCEYTGMGSYID